MLTPLVDFNGDGKQDIDDLDRLTFQVAINNATNLNVDVDGNRVLNFADVETWLSVAATRNGFAEPYMYGDTNLDGLVDAADLNVIGTNWGARRERWSSGNFLAGAIVDSDDLNALALNWQKEIPRRSGGDGTFGEARTYRAGTDPRAIAVGDFDGDTVLDVAIANYESDNISVRLGLGDGTFSGQQKFPTGGRPTSVIAADLNGDGILDLSTANGKIGFNKVSVLIGNGNGTFAEAQHFAAEFRPGDIVADDFNGDNILDLAVTHDLTDEVSILLGNGDGTFPLPTKYPVGRRPISIVTGDFDGNGTLDLLTGGKWLTLLPGNGDGTFAEGKIVDVVESLTILRSNSEVVAGDFDGDGILDIANVSFFLREVSIYLGLGNGEFSAPDPHDFENAARALTTADFNGDDILDIATVNEATNEVSILIGRGDGTFLGDKSFTPPARFTTGVGSLAIATGDFDGDGVVDLVTANGTRHQFSVLLGNAPTDPRERAARLTIMRRGR